jgi:glycosyltransferase involved in cell wall biosynthesis
VLAIGRLSHYKGFDYLIDAARHMPEAHCLIVGDGEMRAELLARIEAEHVARNVRLAGRLPAEQLHALLENCEVFCLPSIERTEAFGLVLVEAMARRKPVVACKIPGSGVGWVVRDAITGLLAEPMDAADLAAKIRTALERPELGDAGWTRVKTDFAMAQVAEQIRQVYLKIS